MKKEASTSRVWMADLQEQNDRLSSQLFMYQMQLVQQISLNQQQNIITSAALSGDFDNEAIKNEINSSSS